LGEYGVSTSGDADQRRARLFIALGIAQHLNRSVFDDLERPFKVFFVLFCGVFTLVILFRGLGLTLFWTEISILTCLLLLTYFVAF